MSELFFWLDSKQASYDICLKKYILISLSQDKSIEKYVQKHKKKTR